MAIETALLAASEEAGWDEFVAGHHLASQCHLAGWRRVIERAYRHRSHYLIARDGPEVRGVLPLVFLGSRLAGRSLVSMPFLDDGGACASDGEALRALEVSALDLAARLGAEIIDLRHRRPVGLGWPEHGDKRTLRLDLRGGSERVWSSLDGKVRNQVRKGQKAGLSVTVSGGESLDDFYGPFAVNMRDLGSPVHSRAFFAALFEEFRDSARLAVVRLGDRPIGGAISLAFRDAVQVPWASCLRQFLGLSPNNVLYWELIKTAADAGGYAWFDFGRSSPGSGTYRFKKQWGAVDEPLHWQYRSLGGERRPMADSQSGAYALAVRVWRRLPVPLTRALGPLIRRHISN